jgi:hypothetical protein
VRLEWGRRGGIENAGYWLFDAQDLNFRWWRGGSDSGCVLLNGTLTGLSKRKQDLLWWRNRGPRPREKMADLVDLTRLDEFEESVRQRLAEQGCAWVIGRPGSGRSTLTTKLRQSLSDARFVDLPPMGPDAAIHGLIQAASATQNPEILKRATQDHYSFIQRVKDIAQALVDLNVTVVLNVPRTWPVVKGAVQQGPAYEHQRRARQFLESLLSNMNLRAVVIFSRASDLPVSTGRDFGSVELPWAALKPEGLLDAQSWGYYSEEAERVYHLNRQLGSTVSPVALRMAVGLLALGETEEVLRSLFLYPEPFLKIGVRLIELLSRESNHEVLAGLKRYSKSRFPHSREDAKEIAGLPEKYWPLLTECAGYGDLQTRINEWLRERLDSVSNENPDSSAHLLLAQLYAARDGVDSVSKLTSDSAVPWLERVHHLGCAGEAGESEWSSIDGLSMDQIWDRARSLSIYYKSYGEAADLYRTCTTRDGNNSYSWHYLAYNREKESEKKYRAGGALVYPDEIDSAYRRAVELEPSNPWWNGRLVRYLIQSLRLQDAKREWALVKDRCLAQRAPSRWMAENLHLPIIHAWLKRGFVLEAKAVLEELPNDMRKASHELAVLQQQVDDADESERLGESVYPPELSMESRWKIPNDLVDNEKEESALDSWHPSRIVRVEEGGVRVVFATTSEESEDERRILSALIPFGQWELATGKALEESLENPFAVIAFFKDGSMRIRPMRRGFVSKELSFEPNADATYDEIWRQAMGIPF